MSFSRLVIVAVIAMPSTTSAVLSAPGEVLSHQKISDTEGNLTRDLDGCFGGSVTSMGDLDGDRVGDLAVGAPRDSVNGPLRGAVWVLFLNANGTVKSHQKISDTEGGLITITTANPIRPRPKATTTMPESNFMIERRQIS